MWVIANPSKHRDFEAFHADITARIRALTGEEARWETTTPEDPGTGAAVRAVAAGASRIIAAGGDGTVRAVAAGLAHTGVPLGILPEGTGNILARNLGIPLRSRADALRVALGESVEDIDLGWLRIEEGRANSAFPPEGGLRQRALSAIAREGADRFQERGGASSVPETTSEDSDFDNASSHVRADEWAFLTIAGCGFDGDTMARTRPSLKKALGWPAYVLAAFGAAGAPRLTMRLHRELPTTSQISTHQSTTLPPDGHTHAHEQDSKSVRRDDRHRGDFQADTVTQTHSFLARCVMFANCPRLPLMTLSPLSSLGDGLMEVIRVDTRGHYLGWGALAARIFAHRLPVSVQRGSGRMQRRGKKTRRDQLQAMPSASRGVRAPRLTQMDFFPTPAAVVEVSVPTPVQVDGDPVGYGQRIRVRLDHRVLTVAVP